MHSIGFCACDQAGMKISTDKPEVLCLSRNIRQCMLHVGGNALQQIEKFKYLALLLTSDGWQEIDKQIGKANPVLPEVVYSVVTKRELSNTAKLSVFKSFPMA